MIGNLLGTIVTTLSCHLKTFLLGVKRLTIF